MAGAHGHDSTLARAPAPPLPALCDGENRTSVYAPLKRTPGSFAFARAVDLVLRDLRAKGVADPKNAVRFTVNPNLSFPPGDIERLTFSGQGADSAASIMLNLMGLHGAGSPLPAYFTEHVAQHQDENDPLRDFLDVFNHRLIRLLYGIWKKYRYYLLYREGARDHLSARFFGFIGMGGEELRRAKNLDWARLLAYSGLIAFKSDAGGSLERILQHYFSHPDIHIVPCIRRTVDIPRDQQNGLGAFNSSLGIDLLIGETIQDQTGKFRIRIADLSWARFSSFLPGSENFSALKMLIATVLRSRLHFEVELCLRPEEVRPLRIGEQAVTRLGWSTWLGEEGDGIVNLEPLQEALS